MTLTDVDLKPALERLARVNRAVLERYPGERAGRQAVHTVYGGAQLFKANCGSCHTLSAAGTSGAVGPKLDGLHLSAADVTAAMKAGPGAMPSFSGAFSPAQQSTLASYVAQASG